MSVIQPIFDAVAEAMQELTGSGQPLAVVYPYPEGQPEQFPCAIMDVEAGMSQSDIHSHSKMLSVNVIVRVLMRQKNTEEATQLRMSIMDSVIAKFTESDLIDDLGGACNLMDVASIEPIFIAQTADQPLFGFDLTIVAKKVMDAT